MTALGKCNLALIVMMALAFGIVIGNRGALHGYGLHCASIGQGKQ